MTGADAGSVGSTKDNDELGKGSRRVKRSRGSLFEYWAFRFTSEKAGPPDLLMGALAVFKAYRLQLEKADNGHRLRCP